MKSAGFSRPGIASWGALASEFAIRAHVIHLLDYRIVWAMNADHADELRPDGHNPCNGDETIAIATRDLHYWFMSPYFDNSADKKARKVDRSAVSKNTSRIQHIINTNPTYPHHTNPDGKRRGDGRNKRFDTGNQPSSSRWNYDNKYKSNSRRNDRRVN